MLQAFGETITALSDGFIGGEEDCLKFIEYNLQKHHERATPENMKFMVGIKTT
jgi:hypothetical protein